MTENDQVESTAIVEGLEAQEEPPKEEEVLQAEVTETPEEDKAPEEDAKAPVDTEEEPSAENTESKDDTSDSDDVQSDGDEKVEEATPDDGRQWFILQCFTGQELKVSARIQRLVDEKKLESKVLRVLVPEEETIEIRDNKRFEKTSRIFPGYVFIQIIIDSQLCFELSRITGVAKFVGTKSTPTPVTDDEILKVLRKIGDKTKKVEVDFEEGEVIKVIGGPFRGYSGSISEINPEKGKLKTLISIFGRETPVELEFDQVEKAVAR
ncbi:MAG: transcription termination/antitermination factor NusG [Candidatus Margulisbacteria bacterium]|nr:transcription termination/antitermination factor NusG [Candidatus Margulisiibacteriota bacterium]